MIDPEGASVVVVAPIREVEVVGPRDDLPRPETLADGGGQQVDLVGVGGRDQHVGVLDAGVQEDVGPGAVAADGPRVDGVAEAPEEVGVPVDDRHRVIGPDQHLGRMAADLARTADHDPHVDGSIDLDRSSNRSGQVRQSTSRRPRSGPFRASSSRGPRKVLDTTDRPGLSP